MADRRLQVFHTVGRMLSFTKAAEVLQMTQPAVTFQIRQLEEQLNVRLFDRSHNRIDLTEAGKRAFEYAEQIFGLYGEMENSIREVTGTVSGLLRVGADNTAAQYVLPAILADFQAEFPEVHIQYKTGNAASVISMVENSFVDVAIVENSTDYRRLINKAFGIVENWVVFKHDHPMASRNSVDISELMNEKWILREENDPTREAFFAYLRSRNVDVKKLCCTLEFDGDEAIKMAVSRGRGIAVLPQPAIEEAVRSGEVAAVRLEPSFKQELIFVHKEQKFPLRVVDELLKFAPNSLEATAIIGAQSHHFKNVVSG
jgi:DNA-binding transcriptional LysR family regulator